MAIFVAVTMAVLLGFVGLALDLGKLFVAKTELQNGADACALAAARELTGTNANQLEIAEAAGIATGTRNRVLFQKNAIELVADKSVEFSADLSTGYATKGTYTPSQALTMKFARCTVERTGIANWLIDVLNLIPEISIGPQAVGASAVASLVAAQNACALPVSICSADLVGKTKGDWLEGAIGPGAADLTGSFKWVDFAPPAGGAAEIADVLKGPGVCNIPAVGAEVGEQGVKSSVADEWNSRFGIYGGSTKLGDSIPDFTGYAYTDATTSWPSKSNAYADFTTQRESNSAYQGDAATGLNVEKGPTGGKPATGGKPGTGGGASVIADSTYLKAHGSDRRLAIVPVVDCAELATGVTAKVKSWACILMLHPINPSAGGGAATGSTRMYLEYLGQSNDSESPCATLGRPGSETSVGPLVPALVQ